MTPINRGTLRMLATKRGGQALIEAAQHEANHTPELHHYRPALTRALEQIQNKTTAPVTLHL